MKIIFFLLLFFVKINYSFADLKIAYIDINFILIHSLVGQKIEKHINKIKEENILKRNITKNNIQKIYKKETIKTIKNRKDIKNN